MPQTTGVSNETDLNSERCRESRSSFAIAASLFVLVAIVYWPACNNGFVNWDDNSYVCNREEILRGINGNSLVWAATANVEGNWHPVTLLSLQLDAQLFGVGPRGFHRTSVLIHAINAALAFLAIQKLTGCWWRSFFVAALFSLHPMRVESVAWVSERKDLVSGLFFLLTILAYFRYVRTRTTVQYVLVACLLALGLAAKPMLVTTPCVLLLLDYWPLNRIQNCAGNGRTTFFRLVIEKLPLFGLVALASLITVLFQQAAIKPLARFSPGQRFGNAAYAIIAYVVQSIWPVGLSPFYTFANVTDVRVIGAVIFVVAICLAAWWQWTRRPYFAVGWFWFLGMLVPVCGLIQVGNQARADRYTYLPHLGFFLAIVWTVAELVRHSKIATRLASCLCCIYLTGLVIVTQQQIPVWSSTANIWQRAYAIDSKNGSIIDFWLSSLVDTGKLEEASRIANKSIEECDETDANKMRMLIIFLMDLGENDIALHHLDRALKHHPEDVDLIARKARAYAAKGEWQMAADEFLRASRLAPNIATYQFFLAHALDKAGQQVRSQQVYSAALRQTPGWADEAVDHVWRMSTSWKSRDRRDPFWTVCLAEQASAAAGGQSSHHLDVLAAAYANGGRFDDAIEIAKQALELAESSQKSDTIPAIRERLSLYENQKPYRQVKPPSLGAMVY